MKPGVSTESTSPLVNWLKTLFYVLLFLAATTLFLSILTGDLVYVESGLKILIVSFFTWLLISIRENISMKIMALASTTILLIQVMYFIGVRYEWFLLTTYIVLLITAKSLTRYIHTRGVFILIYLFNTLLSVHYWVTSRDIYTTTLVLGVFTLLCIVVYTTSAEGIYIERKQSMIRILGVEKKKWLYSHMYRSLSRLIYLINGISRSMNRLRPMKILFEIDISLSNFIDQLSLTMSRSQVLLGKLSKLDIVLNNLIDGALSSITNFTKNLSMVLEYRVTYTYISLTRRIEELQYNIERASMLILTLMSTLILISLIFYILYTAKISIR